MADSFKRPGKPEFEPAKQLEIRADFDDTPPEGSTDTPIGGKSRAEVLIGEYDETIQFAEWLESLLDEELKEVVVEIDPEEQPEVWMAMQRIFANPNPKMTYQSYVQVLAALEEVDAVESVLDDPETAQEDQFIRQLTNQTTEAEVETDTPEMTILSEDTEALNEATQIRTLSGAGVDIEPIIQKARAYLVKLRQQLRWWIIWRGFNRFNTLRRDQVDFRALQIATLQAQIDRLETAIKTAKDTDSADPLNGLI